MTLGAVRWTLFGAVVGSCLGMVGLAAFHRPEPPYTSFKALSLAPAQPAAPDDAPVIAYLGDSYTGGSAMGGGGFNGFPYLLTRQLGYRYDVFAVGGTGFVQGQPTDHFATRVPSVISLHPDVVLVEGGHNDTAYSLVDVRKAADSVLTRLEDELPDAKIIVQGVPWPGELSPLARGVDDQLRAAAKAHHMPFISAADWFAGKNLSKIGSDGTHPTDAGHVLMTERLAAAFAKLKLPKGDPAEPPGIVGTPAQLSGRVK